MTLRAIMRKLMSRREPIPTLYVKTLAQRSFGPQWSVRLIFTKARQAAPCLLLFEDIDSLVTDEVRSYFLNEVDGLENNDGILMIGSTNNCEFITANRVIQSVCSDEAKWINWILASQSDQVGLTENIGLVNRNSRRDCVTAKIGG
jgi:AAA+ superfamily predicted ATPase